ncbi:hypothetical protein GCM10022221_67660 [Actinocorallia aurea]
MRTYALARHAQPQEIVPLRDWRAPFHILAAVPVLTIYRTRSIRPLPCATDDGRPAVMWTLPDSDDGAHRAVIVAAAVRRGRFEVTAAADGRRILRSSPVRRSALHGATLAVIVEAFGTPGLLRSAA